METEIRNTVLETNWREVCPIREKNLSFESDLVNKQVKPVQIYIFLF